ncbi:MAG: flotillin family protein, partial [Pseudomonadota bacterium]|nr:flotillin family protein [Pseudomonadota bacterium]
MEDLFGTSLVVLVGGVIFALIVITFLLKMYRRASKEIAFVRTGVGGEKVVMNGGALVLPVFHETMPVNMNTVRLAVERKNGDALITLDRLRIDVKAEFYV